MKIETYNEAGEILAKIERDNRQLKTVEKWIERKDDFPFQSIRTDGGLLMNDPIHPTSTEINTMLLLMQQRLEADKRRLLSQFEALR